MDPTPAAETEWAFAAGLIPERSTGHEPESTSRNVLCLLNATDHEGCADVTVFHDDRAPVGPYRIALPARRVRQVRVNDLIDPEAVPLGRPYGMTVTCDVPITVQLVYVDTTDGHFAVTALPGAAGRPR